MGGNGFSNYTPADAPVPATVDAGCDESEYPGVIGCNTPMHPGHDGKSKFRPSVQAKHKAYQREKAPRILK